jgi:ketosteroid isomerase-like protein
VKNKALVRPFLEAQARGGLKTLDELLAPDFVEHSLLPNQDPGREGYMQACAEEHAVFSNIRYKVEYQAAERDEVICRLTISRIHYRGEYFGLKLEPIGE